MKPNVPLLAAGLAWGVACGDSTYGGGGGPSCTPTATQLCMINSAFSPTAKAVAAGTTLTWRNGDSFGHTTTSDANRTGCPTWDHTVNAGQTSPGVAFGTAGVTCNYHCTIHATMQASITVGP